MAGLQQQQFKITGGMNQDIDVQSSSPTLAYRLFNIKNQTLENSNMNNLTNEKGNSQLMLIDALTGEYFSIAGTVIGIIQCTPSVAVLFTYISSSSNAIYKLTYDKDADNIKVRTVARGNFGIPKTHIKDGKTQDTQISGVFVYEHSELQKIYWVDGINQLRYLNIADSNDSLPITEANKLNSCPSFKMDHHIEVKRINGGGVFTSGVIQYAFTYFNKNGAETNIVDMTPLYYIGEEHRGLMADETVGCSYEVTIKNPDTSFDYIRLYSIMRTSLNGQPIVRIVKDIKLK